MYMLCRSRVGKTFHLIPGLISCTHSCGNGVHWLFMACFLVKDCLFGIVYWLPSNMPHSNIKTFYPADSLGFKFYELAQNHMLLPKSRNIVILSPRLLSCRLTWFQVLRASAEPLLVSTGEEASNLPKSQDNCSYSHQSIYSCSCWEQSNLNFNQLQLQHPKYSVAVNLKEFLV